MRLFSLSSKSVFVTKFACFNLEAKFPAVYLLNSREVLYSSWLWSVSLFSISVIFCVIIYFLFTKLLILGVLFSKSDFIAVNAELVAIPLILDILPSISVILAL